MPKQTLFANDARAALLRGVNAVVNPVKVTLGPRGRNVLIDRPGQPLATRDGVTVAKEVSFLSDPFENMGAAYAREVADAAVTEAGDGTTTSSVILQAIVSSGLKLVDSGAEPLHIAEGIERAAKACAETIREMAIQATPQLVRQVAVVSTHGDMLLGNMIADATLKVGVNGVVELHESRDHNTTVEHLEGFFFERGWRGANGINQIFVNDLSGQRCVLKNPLILISERNIVGSGMGANGIIYKNGDGLHNVAKIAVDQCRPLLIIAEDLTGDAYNMFTSNVASGRIPGGCFVKLPGFGDNRTAAINDLQIAVGAKRIHSAASTQEHDQLSSFTIDDLGTCKEAIITPTRTVLVEGNANTMLLPKRIKQLINQSQDATNPYEKEQLDHRLARLTGGVAVLRVGAHSEPAMIEKKARAEDAIHACRGAMLEGVVPGGGVALLRAAWANAALYALAPRGKQNVTSDEGLLIKGTGTMPIAIQAGCQVLLEAIMEPSRQIIVNTGHKRAREITDKIFATTGAWGYDAAEGRLADMYVAGIVDPARVVLVALRKAASIGALLLTTEVLVTDTPEPTVTQQVPPGVMRG